uniref:Uncharacterized protein n=1 Tax=Ditylenchus dipsaci TaxID=166011 RepID=A0A915EIN0_9BILA
MFLKCSALLSRSIRSAACSQIAGAHEKVSTPRVTKHGDRTIKWNYSDEVNVLKKVYSKDAPPGTFSRIWACTAALIGFGVFIFIFAKNDLVNKRREQMVARQRRQQEQQFGAAFQIQDEPKTRPSSH